MRPLLLTSMLLVAGCTALEPPVGAEDPGVLERKPELSRELATEVAISTRTFVGTIALASSNVSPPIARGEVKRLLFVLAAKSDAPADAEIERIRVAGFRGIDVGIERRFQVGDPPAAGFGDLVEAVFKTVFWPLVILDRLTGAGLFRRDPLRLVLPRGRVGVGALLVHVPPGNPPGKYDGRLVLTGNFAELALELSIEVSSVDEAARYRERVARSLATLDRPIESLPLGRLLADRASAKVDFQDDSTGRDAAWERWAFVGDSLWDLANLECLGPVLAWGTDVSFNGVALTGPRERPRLFLVRWSSIDVIDVRARRTIARLSVGWNDSIGPYVTGGVFAVSRDGSRVVTSTEDGGVMFVEDRDGGWSSESISDERLAWFARQLPEPEHAISGIKWEASHGRASFSR